MSDTAHTHENMVPPAALKGAIALVLLSLLLVAAVRAGAWNPGPSAAELRAEKGLSPVAERQLRFEDRIDGFVIVTDARNGQQVAAIGREGSGFIRGVMRGLARERRMHQQGAAAPFLLSDWPDGSLTLKDLATGRTIELQSFGPDNRAAFAGFLNEESAS